MANHGQETTGGILLESARRGVERTQFLAAKVNSPWTLQPFRVRCWLLAALAHEMLALFGSLWSLVCQPRGLRCGRGLYHGFVIGAFCSCVVVRGYITFFFWPIVAFPHMPSAPLITAIQLQWSGSPIPAPRCELFASPVFCRHNSACMMLHPPLSFNRFLSPAPGVPLSTLFCCLCHFVCVACVSGCSW